MQTHIRTVTVTVILTVILATTAVVISVVFRVLFSVVPLVVMPVVSLVVTRIVFALFLGVRNPRFPDAMFRILYAVYCSCPPSGILSPSPVFCILSTTYFL